MAFNTAGPRCARLVVPSAADRQLLADEPMSRNDSHSPVGAVAARAAYDEGDPWLASLVERLDQQRTLLGELLAAHLPGVRMRPLEATSLAWLDATAYGHDDAAGVALERGRVQVSPGESYAPGTTGQVRLDIATSPDQVTEIVARLAEAGPRRRDLGAGRPSRPAPGGTSGAWCRWARRRAPRRTAPRRARRSRGRGRRGWRAGCPG